MSLNFEWKRRVLFIFGNLLGNCFLVDRDIKEDCYLFGLFLKLILEIIWEM